MPTARISSTYAEGTFVPPTTPRARCSIFCSTTRLRPASSPRPSGASRSWQGCSRLHREIQELEDTLWEILELAHLGNADLPRLKVLGKIVGQPRLGFDTETYRKVIEARALANVSRGRPSDILAVRSTCCSAPANYQLTEMGNATLYVTALGRPSTPGARDGPEILPDVRAAGVGLQFSFSDT
jgi:hypothetical protein